MSALDKTRLRPGLLVRVRNDEGGSFVGKVGELSDTRAVIVPQSEPLRRWWPDGYVIGTAHWESYVEVVEA